MHSRFEMSLMGEIKFFLGLQIHQSPRGIFINQAKYTLEILHKHGMDKGQSIGTPMATKPKLDADLSGNPVDHTDYRSKIGPLIFELTAFSNADHAGCIDSRKSTSRGIQFLGDKLVSWMSKKQNCTAMSSAEAEYVALSASCAQVMWMRTQLQDYGFNYNKIPLYYDSQSAIAISCNPVHHSRTKHIHTRYHFIKEQVENGIIELYFVRTEYQLADMFTKALPEDRFKYLVRRIVLRYDGDECDKGRMPTKIELTLEQSQQGVSNDVLPYSSKVGFITICSCSNEKDILSIKIQELRKLNCKDKVFRKLWCYWLPTFRKNDDHSGQFGTQRTVNVAAAKKNVGSKEVPTADSGTDLEPAEQVQNKAGYNVFANHLQHSEQFESVSNTCSVETDDSNVIPDSLDMCEDDIQNKQNDVKSDDERVVLANLIANLKLDVDENKKTQKQLKKANTTLSQEPKGCRAILAKTSKSLGESISIRDSCLVALQTKQAEFEKFKAFNDRTVDYDKLERKLNDALGQLAHKDTVIKEGLKTKAYELSVVNEKHDELMKQSLLTKLHYEDLFRAPTTHDMEILIQTCLMPLAIKTQSDSLKFVHDLKQEMHADLKYVETLEKEIDELEFEKAEFSDMYDVILQECVSKDVMCSYLMSLSDLNALEELQRLYLHKVKEFDCLAQRLLKQTESVSKKVKNDTVCNEKALNVFRKKREQYFEIQDLKAQMQDKNIAISELKKLIEKGKEKSMDTKFDRPSVVRQPNAQRIPKPSVLGKPTPFSNSLDRIHFQKIKSVPKTNVSEGLSKPVTAQNLSQTAKKAVSNTNVHKPGIYRIENRIAHTRAPQLLQTVRNTNLCVSTSTGVNHKPNVSRPQLKSNQSRDKVLPNNSQVKVKKTQVEVHPRAPSVSNKMKSIVQLILFIVDSGCTKHMTGNLKPSCNFVEKFLGTVHFGNDQFAPILGYGDLVQRNVTINRVYYVEGLNHNLFSVGQFCDADLEVAFRKSTCFVRDLQGNDLLVGNRGSDLYTISLQESTSSNPLCLVAKATPNQAWLWHRRLSHLNFDYINLLSKKDIVIGLPKLKYVTDQLCSSCKLSKAKRSSFKSKAVLSFK
nr:retrovirus-related Pol polyprotein from transposon TNT 1-94 [Tanacetum cinerariifolium]